MGPWLCSHGNRHTVIGPYPITPLQWGRGCVATEIPITPNMLPFCRKLQWGRGCVATEIRFRGFAEAENCPLQWGRGCVATEMWSYRTTPADWSPCFNGAVAV